MDGATPAVNLEFAIAAVSAGAAVVSAGVAVVAVRRARAAQRLSERMFRRQGVIELHSAWRGVNRIDCDAPITPDVVNAVGVMELTAALWNHDVIEKAILCQIFWDDYRELFDTLAGSHAEVPGMSRRCCDFISSPLRRAYDSMREFDTRQVASTSLHGRR